jgi:hypothetical protein
MPWTAAAALLVAFCLSAEASRAKAEVLVMPGDRVEAQTQDPLNPLAERYVKLVLALGQHDADYVDAYYGPPEWRAEAEKSKKPLADIATEATALIAAVDQAPKLAARADETTELLAMRRQYLAQQLRSLGARVSMLQGKQLTFDEESKALYDAVAPHHTEAELEKILAQLEKHLPGDGPLIDRYDRFKQAFVIPREKLDTVFQAAIRGCKDRTLAHVDLPPSESFTVEYVTGKTWGGYNWYQGNYRSVIQVNTDLPIYVERALDLACHEGYPGHHVYNALLEQHLVRQRGWVEFSAYALFSPQSLIAEGTANYGIDVAFPKGDRLTFERDVVFPLAGIDPARADGYYAVLELVDKLAYAGNEAARQYLDGKITREAAATWLERYAMMPRARAEQRVRFFDQYRSYVINYNLGKDLVAGFIEHRARDGNPGKHWREFVALLSSPRLPSGLK